jgi:hypothetical protein
MFVRYVTLNKDECSHCLKGVFQVAYQLRYQEPLRQELGVLLRWFESRLPIPGRFYRPGGSQAGRQAICWFKVEAVEHLGKMRELVSLLEQNGVTTRKLRTQRPGYVVYEDAFQVAAVPFRDVMA